MTTRAQLADSIEAGLKDHRVIIDPFKGTVPNLRRKPGVRDDFETTDKVSVYDRRMREVGASIPLRTIVVDVIGLALLGKLGSAEEAWMRYCEKQFPIPKGDSEVFDSYKAPADLLGIKPRSVRRLVCFHTGDTSIERIVEYLRSQDPLLFADDDL